MAKDLGRRLAALTLNQRSEAYRWLHKRHAQIAAQFAASKRRPSWKALAEVAADTGLSVQPDTLRKAWLSLLRDLDPNPVATKAKPQPASTAIKSKQLPRPPLHPSLEDDDFDLPAIQKPQR